MVKLTIDGQRVEVDSGTTILDAAHKIGIGIPALCYRAGCDPSTSCMVCVVNVSGKLLPSCATLVQEDMVVESETAEVHEARQAALELLLSDHIGDCIAPCHRSCPADMNIPLMIRQISSGKIRDAIVPVKNDIALPAVLGRICPAPCEKACRRGSYDEGVAICLLKRFAADVDLVSETPYIPECKPDTGKTVAIIGAGPAGLSAAYYLAQYGYKCVIFDEHEKPGGMLRYGVPEDKLPHKVLDMEIEIIRELGAEMVMNKKIDEEALENLRKEYDAVLISTGGNKEGIASLFKVSRSTLQTEEKDVFIAGNAVGRNSKMAVRSVSDGKLAAKSIAQYLSGSMVTGAEKPFTTNIGKLNEGEIHSFMKGVSDSPRYKPTEIADAQRHGGKQSSLFSPPLRASYFDIFPDKQTGFSPQEAVAESNRCLHCDCRKADNCKLRDYSNIYDASSRKYKGDGKTFDQYFHPADTQDSSVEPYVIYEPGKCIKCGLCVQITTKAREPLGLTFVGRGFDVKIGVPFNRRIDEGLRKVAEECVEACPTGALAFK
ncbi:pyridoxal-phosphate dependent enzyme [Candidatus Poribacteria bacterium]|nr:pyridoxal-phosphate dependent enzyme [Candidatus Poribacteria bacterium]